MLEKNIFRKQTYFSDTPAWLSDFKDFFKRCCDLIEAQGTILRFPYKQNVQQHVNNAGKSASL